VQKAGQVATPEQTKGAQEGVPTEPEERIVQTPFATAPSEAAQTSQPDPQSELQQTPSTHFPFRH
jgi:hypothetical protein